MDTDRALDQWSPNLFDRAPTSKKKYKFVHASPVSVFLFINYIHILLYYAHYKTYPKKEIKDEIKMK